MDIEGFQDQQVEIEKLKTSLQARDGKRFLYLIIVVGIGVVCIIMLLIVACLCIGRRTQNARMQKLKQIIEQMQRKSIKIEPQLKRENKNQIIEQVMAEMPTKIKPMNEWKSVLMTMEGNGDSTAVFDEDEKDKELGLELFPNDRQVERKEKSINTLEIVSTESTRERDGDDDGLDLEPFPH